MVKWIIKYQGRTIGSCYANSELTKSDICEYSGVELAVTIDDRKKSPYNGMYIMDELEFREYEVRKKTTFSLVLSAIDVGYKEQEAIEKIDKILNRLRGLENRIPIAEEVLEPDLYDDIWLDLWIRRG